WRDTCRSDGGTLPYRNGEYRYRAELQHQCADLRRLCAFHRRLADRSDRLYPGTKLLFDCDVAGEPVGSCRYPPASQNRALNVALVLVSGVTKQASVEPDRWKNAEVTSPEHLDAPIEFLL